MNNEGESTHLPLTVYHSGECGNAKNCRYPFTGTGSTPEELRQLFRYDHTLIRFQNNYRSISNFLESATVVLDNDNDHTTDPGKWIPIEDIPKLFPGVFCVVSTSRNHRKQKGDKAPRDRYHIIFPVDPITDADTYTQLTQRIQARYPFFDEKALDAGRFFFGNPDTEVYIFPGDTTIDKYLWDLESEEAFAVMEDTIPEGSRNSTLSHAAGKILKRWGDTKEAGKKFLEEAEKCHPPLEREELQQIWNSALKFYRGKVKKQPDYVPPEEYNAPPEIKWEPPIPFTQHTLPEFPVDAFPPAIRDYVLAVAETTQTPVDMAATAALAVLALCQQGKYRIKGKDDWIEPLNLFTVIVAEPSERKSAVIGHMIRAVQQFEAAYNQQHSGAIERSKLEKRMLEKQQRNLEEMVLKGKAQMEGLQDISMQLANFREVMPMRLYVDDVTTEKLTSVLSENKGTAAIVSAEGGIFDMLSGIYTKNVNIDVFLKGHSGDTIRVDRIGRNSESIMNPALTVLLAVQPNVLSGMMSNGTFRGRGLTARFMYCMPHSKVGERKYRTQPIPDEVSRCYDLTIRNLLDEGTPQIPELICLTPEADKLLEAFSGEVENKLKNEFSDMPDWAGKLAGAVLRISGLLCRATNAKCADFLDIPESTWVSKEAMAGTIAIGRYFTEHARAAYTLMGADALVKQSQYALDAILKTGLLEFNRRDLMRLCRSFKTADAAQVVLNHLTDLGYLALKDGEQVPIKGRPSNPIYLVNPWLYQKSA